MPLPSLLSNSFPPESLGQSLNIGGIPGLDHCPNDLFAKDLAENFAGTVPTNLTSGLLLSSQVCSFPSVVLTSGSDTAVS